jgi:hypothetical protein
MNVLFALVGVGLVGAICYALGFGAGYIAGEEKVNGLR